MVLEPLGVSEVAQNLKLES